MIIPAKYDYGELWRWGVILDRFVLSAGNTIGITAAGVSTNQGARPEPVVWLNGLRDAGVEERSSTANRRETIAVGARNPQRSGGRAAHPTAETGYPRGRGGDLLLMTGHLFRPSINVPGARQSGVVGEGEQRW